jgi:hypothetical protein
MLENTRNTLEIYHVPTGNMIRAALKVRTSFCHSKYFSFTLCKGQENWLTEATIFASSFSLRAIFEEFIHSDAARQKRKR